MATTTSLYFDILAKDKTAAGLSSARKRAAGAFLAIGAAAVGYGVMAVKAAAQDQQAASVLAQTLKNTTGARQADIDSVEDWIGQLTLATGVADDQLRPALGNLLRATGDQAKSQDLLKIAMDASAATGKDLETITLAMGRAAQGQTGGLSRLGIATKDASGNALDATGVFKAMADQFGGAQAAKTDTAAGKMQVMQNALDEATEAVGYGLLPILTTLATFLAGTLLPPIKSVTDWMGQNSNATKVLGGVLLVCAAGLVAVAVGTRVATAAQAAWKAVTVLTTGATATYAFVMGTAEGATLKSTAATVANTVAGTASRVAMVAVAAATGVVTAAQWLLNAALTANPIGIVIAAIVGLIAVFVLLYKKNETVRRIIDAVWSGIKTAIGAVVGWFQNTAWPIIKTVAGYIGGYYKTLFGIVKAAWNGIKGAISAVVGWFRDTAWPKIKVVADLIGGIWSGIATAAKSAFNLIASAWNNTVGRLSFSIPDWVPGLGGRGWDVPDIPMLAAGGIVTRPTLAMIGEAGPEAVVPLSRGLRGGGAHVEVHVNGVNDPVAVRAAARQGAVEALQIVTRRVGVA